MMKHKKIFVSCIVPLIISVMALEVLAFDITDLRNKLQNLNNNRNEIKKDIRANEKKQKDVTQKIRNLEYTIQKLENEIKEINKGIVETENKIETTKKDLIIAEENIETKEDTLNSRLKVMYKNGDIGYIEVLLNSANFEDLLARLDMVKRIFNHDVDLIKYLKEQRDLMEQKKAVLEIQRSDLAKLMNSSKSKQNNLKVSRGEMQRVKKELQKDHKSLEKEEDKLNDLANKIKSEIIRKQSAQKYVGGKMVWPAPGYYTITSPFGYRIHPILRKRKLHTGIDVRIPTGKNIGAAQSGRIMHSGWLGGYGKVVMIDHGGGIVTLYAHNSRLVVKEGQKVNKGDIIAKAGSTGMSTGPHLHFEVRENGQYVDPLKYLKKQ